jgi:2-polyprenyl-6-methoxyphenol hydroxylase-like FAD-dependent oxidoreductase
MLGEAMTHDAPVLIVGGGMVGLSAATFLAQQDVPSIVIERLKTTSPLPRAAFFHMRTLEMFRSVGIESRVRQRSEIDYAPEGAIIIMDAISGRKLADIIPTLNEGVDALSPCRRLFVNQPSLEPILRDRAREAGATVLQGAEVIGVRQDADGVTIRVRDVDSGGERELRGRYVIAADGAHSRVRELLGIPFEGRGVFSSSITIYFTADLSPWLADKAWSVIYVNNAVLGGFFRMDRSVQSGFLAVNTVGDAKRDPEAASNAAADVSEGRLIELVRAGVGQPELAVRIDGCARWRATADVAQRLQDGRIFLAGDAAHLMPPNGGFGGNTGIHDAHNLAWKLALVLKGQASPRLLDTYESERKPVARFTTEQAFTRYVMRTAPWLQATQQTEPLAPDFHIELGYLYDSPLGVHADPTATCGVPGSRAAHIWLERGGQRISTMDLVGHHLLLAGDEGSAWIDAARAASERLGHLRLDAFCLGRDIEDQEGAFLRAYGITSTGASLVRPDGFVAWRSPTAVDDPAGALSDALRRSLGF